MSSIHSIGSPGSPWGYVVRTDLPAQAPRLRAYVSFLHWLGENPGVVPDLPKHEVVEILVTASRFVPGAFCGGGNRLAGFAAVVREGADVAPRWRVVLPYGPELAEARQWAQWIATVPHELLHVQAFSRTILHARLSGLGWQHLQELMAAPDAMGRETAIEAEACTIAERFLAEVPQARADVDRDLLWGIPVM